MPSPELSHRYQAALLWNVTGVDRYGQRTVAPPVQVRVRWNHNRTEMLDPHGNQTTLDASVIVAQEVTIGSLMWLGLLSDWYGTGSGTGGVGGDDELMEVKTSKRVPDIKNRFQQRELGLMRFRGTVPIGQG
jgi:hypothetical protein